MLKINQSTAWSTEMRNLSKFVIHNMKKFLSFIMLNFLLSGKVYTVYNNYNHHSFVSLKMSYVACATSVVYIIVYIVYNLWSAMSAVQLYRKSVSDIANMPGILHVPINKQILFRGIWFSDILKCAWMRLIVDVSIFEV